MSKQKSKIPLSFLFYTGCLLTIVFSLGTAYFQFHPKVELFSHFKIFYLFWSVLLLIVAAFFKRTWLSLSLATITLLNSYYVVPWYYNSNKSIPQDASLKVLLSNVYSGNRRYHKLLTLIRNEEPDIIVLQEINNAWQTALAPLRNAYPYHKEIPREDNFGIAVYSKRPMLSVEQKLWGSAYLPSLLVSFEHNDQELYLAATHPLPPVTDEYYQLRNEQLKQMTQELTSIEAPLIISGDFNLTFWSQQYAKAGLSRYKNVRKGYGVLPSWPSRLLLWGIPIDHILVSQDLEFQNTRMGNNIGSDHLPLISEIVVNPTTHQPDIKKPRL